jgi:preprotein translocase subunit SecG
MNRTLLLIAIAAVAVVVVVAAILLSGAGQPGPLSGSIGSKSTTLTLVASNCSGPDGAGNAR